LLGPTPTSSLTFKLLHTIAVDSDDRILLGGIFHQVTAEGQYDLAAAGRLHADGSWDDSFGDHGLFILPITAAVAPNGGAIDRIAPLATGAMLLSGTTFQNASLGRVGPKNSCILLIKLTSAGALDPTFAPDHSGTECFDFAPQGDTWIPNTRSTLVARSDGTFYATTLATNLVQDSLTLGALARFDGFGTLDSTYGEGGIVVSPVTFFNLNLLPNEDVVGSSAAIRLGAASLDSTGSFNAEYGDDGVVMFDPQQGESGSQPAGARLDSAERLVSGVSFFNGGYSYGLIRLDTSGQPDTTFNGAAQQFGEPGVAVLHVSDGDHDLLTDVMPLPDGHMIVLGESGYAAPGDGVSNVAIFRLNEDASSDTGFGDASHPGWHSINVGGLEASDTRPNAMTSDSAGRLLVGISVWRDGNDHSCIGVARVIADRLSAGDFDTAPLMPSCPQ
jgi:uncharacterized delta-60 repeat protein